MDCLCLNTRRAARSLTRLYEDHLRPSGVTPAQFGLLSLLAAKPGISQAELAEKFDLDQTTLSRNLRLMVANKWVKPKRSQQDARVTSFMLTASGEKLQAAAQPHWEQAQRTMRKKLGADWATALALLQRLAAAAA